MPAIDLNSGLHAKVTDLEWSVRVIRRAYPDRPLFIDTAMPQLLGEVLDACARMRVAQPLVANSLPWVIVVSSMPTPPWRCASLRAWVPGSCSPRASPASGLGRRRAVAAHRDRGVVRGRGRPICRDRRADLPRRARVPAADRPTALSPFAGRPALRAADARRDAADRRRQRRLRCADRARLVVTRGVRGGGDRRRGARIDPARRGCRDGACRASRHGGARTRDGCGSLARRRRLGGRCG